MTQKLRYARLIGLMVMAALAGLIGYWLIMTTFMFYDDEGYVLHSIWQFLQGEKLYDQVFTQYGPWPYFYHWLWTLGQADLMTHTLGRLLTLLHWVVCAMATGLLAGILTRRTWIIFFVAGITFPFLWQMTSEPTHPGSLISATLALGTLFAVQAVQARHWARAALILGVTTALLMLTKINVGLLFGVACASFWIQASPTSGSTRRWLNRAILAGWLAVPWGLMLSNLDRSWVLQLAILFNLSGLGIWWVARDSRTTQLPWSLACRWTLVFFGVLIVGIGMVFATGSTLGALLEGTILAPTRHPRNFVFGLSIIPLTWVIAGVAVVLTGLQTWCHRRANRKPQWCVTVDGIIATVRWGFVLLLASNATTWITIYGSTRYVAFCLPMLPLFLIPLGRRISPEKLLVTGIALGQVLHCYPVAGSQMAWGSFLTIAVIGAGLSDAADWWNARLQPAKLVRCIKFALPALALLIPIYQWQALFQNGYDRYVTSKPLGLPGAEDIRPTDTARLSLRTMTFNAQLHADVLFSRPGMYSFNLWSQVPTPTTRNATHWFWLLSPPEQQAIIDALDSQPRSMVINNLPLNTFVRDHDIPIVGPLAGYLDDNFVPLMELSDFELLMPKDYSGVPFLQVERLELAHTAAADLDRRYCWRTNVVLENTPQKVLVEQVTQPWASAFDFLHSPRAEVWIEPINLAGEARGDALQLPQDTLVPGLYRLSIFMAETPALEGARGPWQLTLRGTDDKVLAECMF